MVDLERLKTVLQESLGTAIQRSLIQNEELTLEIQPEDLRTVCLLLRENPALDFNLLVDVCGVDYLYYGIDQWATESTTATGFERGVQVNAFPQAEKEYTGPRFAVVYHFLSLKHNHRLRLRAFLPEDKLSIESITDIWPSANWFEREAFDLFGILFLNHPDLRRILTDYGFQGHPFRKDFPLIGQVEARYDAKRGRVVYDPVSIEPRILEPKVIRRDARYQVEE